MCQDEISAEERFYIGKILYGCLSCVKSMQDDIRSSCLPNI